MADMKLEFKTFGLAPERIRLEIFNGGEPMTPGVVSASSGMPHVPADDTISGPLVSFARSGVAAHWNASAYQSILELAEAWQCPGAVVLPHRGVP